MTYTYKLARRLAISRDLAMLHVLILVAACAGETPEPEPPAMLTTLTAPHVPIRFRVLPGNVTIETNQLISFRGEMRAVGLKLTPRAPKLAGEMRTFTAVGQLRNGTTAPMGVTGTATGGTIDPAGTYLAGSVADTYHVIATNGPGTLADTVRIRSTLPVAQNTTPDPTRDPPPDLTPNPTPDSIPDPTPAHARVVLRPATIFLATSATHRFAAFGRNSLGDSVAIEVTFHATGGSITPTGLYTAGQTAGTYQVIATSTHLADTSVVTLAATSGGGGPTPIPARGAGIPFGPSGGMLNSTTEVAPFTMTVQGVTPSNIVSYLTKARTAKTSLILNMTGGHHEKYMTAGVFDYARWMAAMDAYNTPAIKQAVAQAIADGTIVGNSVMDEPHVHGGGDGNTWGPQGTMTKVVVDQMCGYAKAMFPMLPVGVAHRHDAFEPTRPYRACEFVISQYSSRHGSAAAFRDSALAMARRDGHAIVFGMNILNGGTQDRDGTWDCIGTGGKGTYAPNCRMTPGQIRENGLVLGPAGCALTMWRYDAAFMGNPENRRAFQEVAGRLSTPPAKACRRQ